MPPDSKYGVGLHWQIYHACVIVLGNSSYNCIVNQLVSSCPYHPTIAHPHEPSNQLRASEPNQRFFGRMIYAFLIKRRYWCVVHLSCSNSLANVAQHHVSCRVFLGFVFSFIVHNLLNSKTMIDFFQSFIDLSQTRFWNVSFYPQGR